MPQSGCPRRRFRKSSVAARRTQRFLVTNAAPFKLTTFSHILIWAGLSSSQINHAVQSLGPHSPLPESRYERILFRPSWNMLRIFSRNFVRPLLLEIHGRKSARCFAKSSPRVSPNFALGDCVHKIAVMQPVFNPILSLDAQNRQPQIAGTLTNCAIRIAVQPMRGHSYVCLRQSSSQLPHWSCSWEGLLGSSGGFEGKFLEGSPDFLEEGSPDFLEACVAVEKFNMKSFRCKFLRSLLRKPPNF